MMQCKKCCSLIAELTCLRIGNKEIKRPKIKINMYNIEEESSENQQLIVSRRSDNNVQDLLDTEYLDEEFDEASLKMNVLDRIQMIEDDLKDPSLKDCEKMIHLMNLSTLSTILQNIKINEKIQLGSLQSSQYTDALIVQKQIKCNLAGQNEYNDIIQPAITMQPSSSSVISTSVVDKKQNTNECETTSVKSILKKDKKQKNNKVPVSNA